MTPQTTLLKALELAAEADALEQSLPTIVDGVERGQLALQSPDRPLLEALIFDNGVITPDRVRLFTPLLNAVSLRGHTPWGYSSWGNQSTYEFLTGDLVCDELLEWCWKQPGAPDRMEPSVARQVRSDRLDALLRDYPLGHVSHERKLQERGFGLTEQWADGQTTFERMVADQTNKLPSTQKEFEWTGTLRRFRQMAKAAAKECPDHRFLPLVPACLAAERAWRAHAAALRFTQGKERPGWVGTWLETLKDLAPPQQGKRGTPQQGWEAFRAWSVRSAPPRVEVVGAVAACWRVMAELFPEDFSSKTSRLLLVDTVTQGLERIGIEELQSSVALSTHYPLDIPFWQDFEEGLGKKEGQEYWTPEEVWKVVLPLRIIELPENSLSSFFTKRMEKWLPKGEQFQWPNVPFWNQVVATWGWSESLRAQARAQGLEQRLEEPSEPAAPTRAKPRL